VLHGESFQNVTGKETNDFSKKKMEKEKGEENKKHQKFVKRTRNSI
jgi:hypothetical protein